MRKAPPLAEALDTLSLAILKGKSSAFLTHSRCVNALGERPTKA